MVAYSVPGTAAARALVDRLGGAAAVDGAGVFAAVSRSLQVIYDQLRAQGRRVPGAGR